MRIFLVVDDANLYQPDFIARFIETTHDEVVGAALVRYIPKQNNIVQYMVRHLRLLYFSEILKLAASKYTHICKDKILPKHRGGDFHSVKSVLDFFKIPYFIVDYDINRESYLTKIQMQHPDVILSSTSLLFKKELLKLPRHCCLNRHASLLPAYRGPQPLFHAYARGEEYVGLSIHTMEQAIDKGVVVCQRKIKIEPQDSLHDLNIKCFAVSPLLFIEALDKIRNDGFASGSPCKGGAYYSFPNEQDWKAFRQRGGRII